MLVETSRIRFYPEYAKTTFLVYALIGSIAVFFLATFIAYAVRYVFAGPPVGTVPQLPRLLWWSTAILFLGSHFLFRAYALVRREKQKQFRIALTISFLLGGLFCIVQSIGIRQLTIEHWELAGNQAGINCFGYPYGLSACGPFCSRVYRAGICPDSGLSGAIRSRVHQRSTAGGHLLEIPGSGLALHAIVILARCPSLTLLE